jgi:hypothetical protein
MDSSDEEDRRLVAFTARLNDWQLAIVAAAYEFVVTTLERVSLRSASGTEGPGGLGEVAP